MTSTSPIVHLPQRLDCVFTPSIFHIAKNHKRQKAFWGVQTFRISTRHGSTLDVRGLMRSLTHKLVFRNGRSGKDRISKITPYTGSPPDGMTKETSAFPIQSDDDGDQVWCPSATGGIDTDTFYISFEDKDTEKERHLIVEAYHIYLWDHVDLITKRAPDVPIPVVETEGVTFRFDDSLPIPF